jgi:LPXTG-motif cell wall-anchored protein
MWNDDDWDGVHDSGEPPVVNETIELWSGSSKLSSVRTGSDGSYSFTSLGMGSYTVKGITPAYSIATSPTTLAVTLGYNENATGKDFLVSGTASHGLIIVRAYDVSSGKFVDGATINVYIKGKTDWEYYSSQQTFTWLFGFLPGYAGFWGSPTLYWRPYAVYKLEIVPPSGYAVSGSSTVEVSIGWLNFFAYHVFNLSKKSTVSDAASQKAEAVAGVSVDTPQAEPGAELNCECKGEISGTKYRRNEAGLNVPWDGPPVEIRLEAAGISRTTHTAADGTYSFKNLPLNKTYKVWEVIPEGYNVVSPPNGVWDSVKLTSPNMTCRRNLDFVNEAKPQPKGRISGFKKQVLDCGLWWPMEGVRMVLLDENRNFLAECTTNWLGSYNFEDLAPGTYIVKEDPVPEGYRVVYPEGGEWVIKLGCGEDRVLVDFLNDHCHGSIRGHKYVDLDADGVHDAGEPGWGNYTIYLKQGGAVVKTTTTDSNGLFVFQDVKPGTYDVVEELADGVFTKGETVFSGIVVAPKAEVNLDAQGKWFLNYRKGAISGFKFYQLDSGGWWPMEGVRIVLLDGEGNFLKKCVTNWLGIYGFDGLDPGTYIVREDPIPAGYQVVIPEEGEWVIKLSSGQNITCKDFFNVRVPKGSITGWKFEDSNRDGVYQPGEKPWPGYTIYLYEAGTTVEAKPAVKTDTEGKFTFTEVEPGDYDVVEKLEAGVESKAPTKISVSVGPGENVVLDDPSEYFLNYYPEIPFGSISGRKWLDANYDGVWDADETETVVGITIKLYKGGPSEENFLDSTVTGEDGTFAFTNLEPGTYTVVEEGKEGYFATTSDSQLIELSAGEEAVVNFGNCPYGRIEGLKVSDQNGDGIQNGTESGLPEVEIILTGVDDPSFLARTYTAGDGTFSFDNLKPGKYNVSETVPRGYYATLPIMVEVKVGPAQSIKVVFANAPYGSIIGKKWVDDGDGKISSEKDTPLGGVTIKLTGATLKGEAVKMETTTAQDGGYSFLLLEAGDYTVTEVYDTNVMEAKTPASVVVDLAPGETKVAEFLNAPRVKGEVVTPPPTQAAGEQLPSTGTEALPWFVAAGLLVLLGMILLTAGYLRRLRE